MRLYQEAIVVGIVCVVIGTLVGRALPRATGTSLFLTGVVAHYAFEAVGANRWYCQNGVACAT